MNQPPPILPFKATSAAASPHFWKCSKKEFHSWSGYRNLSRSGNHWEIPKLTCWKDIILSQKDGALPSKFTQSTQDLKRCKRHVNDIQTRLKFQNAAFWLTNSCFQR